MFSGAGTSSSVGVTTPIISLMYVSTMLPEVVFFGESERVRSINETNAPGSQEREIPHRNPKP